MSNSEGVLSLTLKIESEKVIFLKDHFIIYI